MIPIFSEDKKKIEIRNLFFVLIMPKSQVGSLVFYLDPYRPLEYSIIYFIFFFFFICVCNAILLLSSLLLLIGIFLLRPYESIQKTSDSYQNHDDFQKTFI